MSGTSERFVERTCIHEGRSCRVIRARDRRNGDAPVVLKRLRDVYPSDTVRRDFLREYEIAKSLASVPGVATTKELITDRGALAIVQEDRGSPSLADRLIEGQSLPLAEVFQIAIKIASTLEDVHRQNVVHKDIHPGNILWDPSVGSATLVDFGISQVLNRQQLAAEPIATLEGTIAYMSPEQSGRMNRAVDLRSDFYSLGATLYTLVTGQTPFRSESRLALVHAHIAKVPTAPHVLDPATPEMLSQVIMLLLSKRASDRYQSGAGLAADLERCAAEYESKGTVSSFQLRQNDVEERLRVPQRLYGRENELGSLREACTDGSRLVLVTGEAGVGKTALVQELEGFLLQRDGTFVKGKFDQFNRGTPYLCLGQALSGLPQRALAQNKDQRAIWRQRVLTAIGETGRLLTELIPDLQQVLGEQPALQTLSPEEAMHRLQFSIAAFIRATATAAAPLILFLDDMQWADRPTLQILRNLVTDPTIDHLLIIGSYRDVQIDKTHGLLEFIDHVQRVSRKIRVIHLDPLTATHTAALVADTVGDSPGHTQLAQICYQKTRGNAFFLRRFLESLSQNGIAKLDVATQEWSWEIEAVEQQSMTENVVEFVAGQIGELSPDAAGALQVAACIGDTFHVRTLAFALDLSPAASLRALRESLVAELVAPVDHGFWFAEECADDDTDFRCRFSHDRIRQAARSRLPTAEAASIHARIGRALLLDHEAATHDELLFETVEQLNLAGDEISEHQEVSRLCDLNLAAAKRAGNSAAYNASFDYYNHALLRMGENPWKTNYDRTLIIHVEGARMAYLSGKTDVMDQLCAASEKHGASLLDRVGAQEVRIHALVAAQRFNDAVDAGLNALDELGVKLPRNPTGESIQEAVGGALELFEQAAGDAMYPELHRLDDPTESTRLRVQSAIISSAYLAAPALLPLLTCNIVRSSLESGCSSDSAYGFVVFALILNASNLANKAYRVGTFGLEALRFIDDPSVKPKTQHVFNVHVKPFVDPLREALAAEREVFQLGIETGDLEYASWGLHNVVCMGFYAGERLVDLDDTAGRNLAILNHYQQLPAFNCTVQYAQVIKCLSGNAPNLLRMENDDYNESAHWKELVDANFRGAAYILGTVATFLRYVFRDLDGAIEVSALSAPYADGATSTYHVVWFHQFSALAKLGKLNSHSSKKLVRQTIEDISPSLKQLKVWEAAAPDNHRHRVLLVEAEVARIEGRRGDASRGYDAAIAAARAKGFSHEEAIANELAARFHLGCLSPTAGRAYIVEAIYVFERWGAGGKSAHLATEYKDLLAGVVANAPRFSDRPTGAPSFTPATTKISSHGLDVESLFKASHSIASEIVLDDLLNRIVDVAIENAGATKGVLIVEKNDRFSIASARDAHGVELFERGTPLGEGCDVPSSLVSYVARTGEPLLLNDVREDARWSNGGRNVTNTPTSVICMPVVHQGQRDGILYLENNLTTSAFSARRLELLGLLCTHAAISMRNARITAELRAHRDHLEDLVSERTTELKEAVDELRRANGVLDRLSLTDALTNLPNRRSFDQRLEDEWARARRDKTPLAILLIDVDFFKLYNDEYGHGAGDECLRHVATAIASSLHRATDYIARYGGEEFAAILPQVDNAGAAVVGEAMVNAVRNLAIPHAGSTIGKIVTISGGSASCTPGPDSSPATLVERSDRSLYRAKAAGRNKLEVEKSP